MQCDYQASVLYINIAREFALESALPNKSSVLVKLSEDNAYSKAASEYQKISLSEITAYWNKAARLSNDPAFGFHAGQSCHLAEYGLFSHVLMNCPSILKALQHISDYLYLMNEALKSTMTTANGITTYMLTNLAEQPSSFQHVEFHFASIVQLGRQIVKRSYQEKISPVRIDFAHAPVLDISEYEAYFKCPVFFNQRRNKIVSTLEVLQTPTHAPNQWLYKYLLNRIDSLYRAQCHKKKYTIEVYHILSNDEAWSDWPTLEEISELIGVSASSLKRKLKGENNSYQQICDHVKFKMAKQMLMANGRSINETSELLGFSSAASFSRSFKRWSSFSPSVFLAQIKNE